MRREDCYEMFLDRKVYDVIVDRFGVEATAELTAEKIDRIRVRAWALMEGVTREVGPQHGLFEAAAEQIYISGDFLE